MSRSLKTVAREMAKYRLDVGGPRVALSRLGIVLLFVTNGMKIINGGGNLYSSVELGSDRISWGQWCDVTILKARAPTEDKSSDSRGSLC
jgi:hypothetical protein